jgi:glycosyltransferase involved in cell wall biosynthesis
MSSFSQGRARKVASNETLHSTVWPEAGRTLIIQIPCYNEAASLPITLQALPRELVGIERVEWLIVDDGSTDQTVAVAQANKVDHIVRLPCHQGLARAFMAGIEASLRAGADIIVTTDADNQYCAEDIPQLIAPILAGKAEIVIGARPIDEIQHFSFVKKFLQKFGSWVVRLASKTDILDAPSGFRALSREAAMRLHVFNEYTYTLETVIQAGQKDMAITSVPIHTNEDLRPSRLVKSIPTYLRRQVLTILRIFMTYKPFQFFAVPGVFLFSCGMLIGIRFVYFYVTDGGSGHVQSLILATLLMSMGFFLSVVGLLADLMAVNRKLLEDLDWRMKKVEERLEER